MIQADILAAKKALWTVTRLVKRRFYQAKLEHAATSKDIFGITKWHRSIGSFRTPPLKDPLNPQAKPAITIDERRDILAKNLLQTNSEVGDILSDSPTVGLKTLSFPDLTDLEVRDAVFSARNTAAGEDENPTAI